MQFPILFQIQSGCPSGRSGKKKVDGVVILWCGDGKDGGETEANTNY